MKKYSFDFSDSPVGWRAGFADYDPKESEGYRLQHGFRQRPPTAGKGGSLFISGMNRSDDLFMYHKRRFDGLRPNGMYQAWFRVVFASKYVSQTGIGGDPARSVYVKVCSATLEPNLVPSDGQYRLNIDIGRQSCAGKNSVVLGNIEKPFDGNSDYVQIESSSDPLKCSIADDGTMWLLFGTDSGYEGETALFYTNFEVELDD